jgi:hypothetical protein
MGRDARSLTVTGPWRAAALGILALLALALALAAGQPAAAQDRHPPPSAEELWDSYPLHPAGESRSAGEAQGSRTPVAAAEDQSSTRGAGAPASPATADGGGLPPALVVLVVLIVAAAAAGLLLWTRRRRVAPSGDAPVPEDPAVAPRARTPARLLVPTVGAAAAGATWGGARGPDLVQARGMRSDRGSATPEPRGALAGASAAPPDPARPWTAEVEWFEARRQAGFRVVARAADGANASTVAESATFEWPPAESRAVQALTAAAEELEAGLLAAGWAPMPPGDAWYAKRFAWTGVQLAPDPVVEPVSPKPGTPWWCEIEWRTAVVSSRFHVVAHGPDRRRGSTVASSPGKWFLMSEPDPVLPDVRAELRHLADAVERAGWESAGIGVHWYAERFAWRREEPPPDRLDFSSR